MIVLLFLTPLYMLHAQQKRTLPIAEAQVTEEYNTVSAGGRLQPRTRIEHQAIAGGYVLSVAVDVGRQVSVGEELFTIKRDDLTESYKPVVISSRINGIVSKVLVQKEDEVRSGETGVIVIGTEGYILEASISDKDAFKVDVGERITGHTMEGDTVQGRLISRSPEPDYTTGLFYLTFAFPNSQNAYIGQFVMVDLPVDRVNGIFVERELLVRRYGTFYLWTVDDSNTLHAREVKTGPIFGDKILIKEGLSAGERYLTRLTGREREGQKLGTPGE
jgi:multidrug efflux pump subunit AcrA (membrane-fusion protein)